MRIAVLGGGNGGCAASGHLTLSGHKVSLFTRNAERIRDMTIAGGLEVEGPKVTGFARLEYVGDSLERAIEGAEVVMLAVPGTAHEYYAQRLGPLLTPDQSVFLNPGHTGGGLHFVHVARKHGLGASLVAESNTLTYACRLTGPAKVGIYNLASVLLSAFPGDLARKAHETIRSLYPNVASARSMLETSLVNLNAVLHPPGTLLNAGWIERSQGDFYYYYEGTTPAVGALMDALDEERVAVAKGYGLPGKPYLDYFCESGYTTPEARDSRSSYEAMKVSAPNRWLKGPKSLKHRYLDEDVPFGLVPMSRLGRLAGLQSPVMDAFVTLCGRAVGKDYWALGLSLEDMGLGGMDVPEVIRYVTTGTGGR